MSKLVTIGRMKMEVDFKERPLMVVFHKPWIYLYNRENLGYQAATADDADEDGLLLPTENDIIVDMADGRAVRQVLPYDYMIRAPYGAVKLLEELAVRLLAAASLNLAVEEPGNIKVYERRPGNCKQDGDDIVVRFSRKYMAELCKPRLFEDPQGPVSCFPRLEGEFEYAKGVELSGMLCKELHHTATNIYNFGIGVYHLDSAILSTTL